MFNFRRKSKKPKSDRSKLIAKADTLFSKLVRERDGHCQWPGCQSTTIYVHHIFSRRYLQLRRDFDNCVSLCLVHHMITAHGGVAELFRDFVIKRMGEDNFLRLKARALMRPSPMRLQDIDFILLGLKEKSKEMKNDR